MASNVIPMPGPGDYRRIQQRIKKLWTEGNTEITYHAQQRMKERRFDITDIQNVIRYGRIVEHSKPGTFWRYTLSGKAVDGDPLKCVVEINGNLIIVTVI